MVVADNKYYKLEVDTSKNRIYITILGFWASKSVVPDYIKDWDYALKLITTGFTVLADVRKMKIHPQDVIELHNETIRMTTARGYSKTAELISTGLAKVQIDRIYKENEVNKNKFETIEDAENYLNSVELPNMEMILA